VSFDEVDLVNEMVEQALVDNLIEGGNFYSNSDIENRTLNNINRQSHNPHLRHSIESQQSMESSRQSSVITNSQNSNSLNSLNSFNNDNDGTINDETPLSIDKTNQNDHSSPIDSSSSLINILIKFVNEKEMKIQVKPTDTIFFLKM
jgi:hydroxylamine reductase (hybrid-cluster protein)